MRVVFHAQFPCLEACGGDQTTHLPARKIPMLVHSITNYQNNNKESYEKCSVQVFPRIL